MTFDFAYVMEATNLTKMLNEAFFREGQYFDSIEVDADSIDFSGPSKTITQGRGTVYWDQDNHGSDDFTFNVNLGTQKDDLVVYDQLEIVIEMED